MKLFHQHCQLPNLSPMQHLRALCNELKTETMDAANTPRGHQIVKTLQTDIDAILNPTAKYDKEQRVIAKQREEQQRVIDETPIRTVTHITTAEPIMQSRNPTTKRELKNTPRLHGRITRNNTPGAVPPITQVEEEVPIVPYQATTRPPIPTRAQHRMVTQQAINVLTIQEQATLERIFAPRCLKNTFQPRGHQTSNTTQIQWCIW